MSCRSFLSQDLQPIVRMYRWFSGRALAPLVLEVATGGMPTKFVN